MRCRTDRQRVIGHWATAIAQHNAQGFSVLRDTEVNEPVGPFALRVAICMFHDIIERLGQYELHRAARIGVQPQRPQILHDRGQDVAHR